MAVVYENISDTLVRAYSDKGVYIQGGMPAGEYTDAVDPKNQNRKYVETDTAIAKQEATIEDYQKALRELGVEI